MFRLLVLIMIATGCATNPPVLNPRAVGCFEVNVSGWTGEMTDLVGAEPPDILQLDAAFAGNGTQARWAWPTDWDQRTKWSNIYGDWLVLAGDTVINVPYGPAFHVLGQDSIVVDWTSRKANGSVTMFLAAVENGFAGLGMLYPRPLAREFETPFFRLSRVSCSDPQTP